MNTLLIPFFCFLRPKSRKLLVLTSSAPVCLLPACLNARVLH
jgi:hypothetical protein